MSRWLGRGRLALLVIAVWALALASPGLTASASVLSLIDADAGDINQDGFVDLLDLRLVVSNFGTSAPGEPGADLNQDAVVDVFDLALVARNLGRFAPQSLGPMQLERAFPNLTFPFLTNLVQPDDGVDHIFVTEQAGRIRVFPNDQNAAQPATFLDITDRVLFGGSQDEQGLLSLAFHPEYADNGYFYVYYSASNPRRSVVSRFSLSTGDPKVADSGSELVIIEILQPFSNHNGGQIAFGLDGYLYIGLGDGGSAGDPQGNGQNVGTLLGSLLRIDVDGVSQDKNYRIPTDNPFVGVDGALGEIWAYGLRNPWRFSFDEATGFLWVGDVGQGSWEEIDVVSAGGNYGWKVMEGAHCFSPSSGCNQSGLKLPVAEYSHGEGCSVSGGYVYRGRGMPSLIGAYVYADFCSGRIWGLRYDGLAVTESARLVDSFTLDISSFGQDLARNLYVLSYNGGIYRLVPAG